MSDVEKRFHETWLGMVQPIEGLVVSVPVLVDGQCMQRQPPEVQHRLVELCPPTAEGPTGPEGYTIRDVGTFFQGMLELTPDLFDAGDEQPDELASTCRRATRRFGPLWRSRSSMSRRTPPRTQPTRHPLAELATATWRSCGTWSPRRMRLSTAYRSEKTDRVRRQTAAVS